MSRYRSQEGQASVELVALLPLLAVAALLCWQAVVAGQAVWLSGGAVRAAARAEALGVDPAAAARAVLPPALRPGLRASSVAGGGVRVHIAVPFVGGGSHALGTITVRARFSPQR